MCMISPCHSMSCLPRYLYRNLSKNRHVLHCCVLSNLEVGLPRKATLASILRTLSHDPCGVEVEGGTVPTRDWCLHLHLLTSGGFRGVGHPFSLNPGKVDYCMAVAGYR